jgi:hypothetical protein
MCSGQVNPASQGYEAGKGGPRRTPWKGLQDPKCPQTTSWEPQAVQMEEWRLREPSINKRTGPNSLLCAAFRSQGNSVLVNLSPFPVQHKSMTHLWDSKIKPRATFITLNTCPGNWGFSLVLLTFVLLLQNAWCKWGFLLLMVSETPVHHHGAEQVTSWWTENRERERYRKGPEMPFSQGPISVTTSSS